MTNYILGDLISRLKIASKGHLKSIKVLNTNLSLNILDIFYKTGLISGFKVHNDYIEVILKYYLNRSVFSNIVLVSTPGKKIYWSLHKLSLKSNINNFGGFYIVSTSQGLLISNDCLLSDKICGKVLLKIKI